MDPEVTALAAAVVPYVSAAAGAYGSAVVQRVQDSAADATMGLGGRLLRRLLGREESAAAVADAAVDLAEDPADEDRVAAMRLQIRKALAADPALMVEIRELLAAEGVSVTASGERAIAAQTISGVAVTGDNAHITR
ncbi:hypothetical protein [Actinoplanes solisilvae]|uniref:hypothetical protein n=1 Tax=Actinoplanes solisilvae TaxID=2486853 RepID=UPI000FD99DA9|nr:hypothetical protein [Actinoplanes solisilvae]